MALALHLFTSNTLIMDEKKPYTRESGNEEHDPVETGRKAIEADRKVNEQSEHPENREKEEADDAEKWRNEG